MKKQLFTTLTLTFALLIFANFANASTYFTVNMSGSQMVPPTSSTATAFLAFEMDNLGISRGRIQGTGISSSGISINVQCPSGNFDIPMTTDYYSRSAEGGTEIAAMKNGNCFFKINTVAFPSGEIGGYAKIASPHLAYINQDQYVGTQPFINPDAKGKAAIVLNNNQTKACVIFGLRGMIPIQNIRIFTGKPSENGTLLNTIPTIDYPDIDPSDGYSIFDVSSTNIAKLKSGQLYIEVAQTSPGFRIRGQFHRQRSSVVDYDGDAKTDFVVIRKNTAANSVDWYARRSSDGGFASFNTANASHFEDMYHTPGDYDGDGKDDVAYWINGTFYILQSGNSVLRTENFGIINDNASVIDDFDGDGKTDLAVYRNGEAGAQSYFYYKPSANNPAGNIVFVAWGLGGDYASSGDYDGDARADFVIQRGTVSGQSEIWIRKSSGGNLAYTFGNNDDFVIPGDYDADGKTDVCVVRTVGENRNWYVLRSLNETYFAFPFGLSAGIVSQGDYNGDGKTDVGVWQTSPGSSQNSFWTFNLNDNSVSNTPWGLETDIVVNGYNVH